MKVYHLRALLATLPGDLDITVRCQWEGDMPNGNCFRIAGVTEDEDHSDGAAFVAFDCDQDLEEPRP